MKRNFGVHDVNIRRPLMILGAVAILLGLLAVSISDDVSAAEPQWSYNESTKTLTIDAPLSGVPDNYASQAAQPWAIQRENIEHVIIKKDVTAIGNYSFAGMVRLKDVTFESGSALSSIGTYAFQNCIRLQSSDLPGSVESIGNYAFSNCNSLTSFAVPDSVKTLGTYVWNGCAFLHEVTFEGTPQVASLNSVFRGSCITKIVIPDSVTSATDAFNGCTLLKDVTLGSGLTTLGNNMFYGCYALEGIDLTGVTGLGDRVFYYSGLRSADISGVTTLGTGVFGGAKYFESVILPTGIASIPNEFFSGTAFEEFTVPSSVQSIGVSAFSSCVSLKKITFEGGGANLKTIGNQAFMQAALEEFTMPDGLTTLGGNYIFSGCTSLESLDLNNVTTISGNMAFASYMSVIPACTSLKSIDFGKLEVISGQQPFAGCTSLESADLSGVVNITGATRMFAGCTSLKEVHLSAGITAIPDYMFMDCKSLTSVDCGNLLTIGQQAFDGCESLAEIPSWNTLVSIGTYGFRNTAISEFKFSNDLKTLGTAVFMGSKIKKIDSWPSGIAKMDLSVFPPCEEITIPNGVTEIIGSVGSLITSFHIPDSVTDISNDYGGLFNGASSLKEITGGAGLTTMGSSSRTFNECVSLETLGFNFPAGSKYTVIDNILYQKSLDSDELMLVYVPAARTGSYVTPSNVIMTVSYAFNSSSLTSITTHAHGPIGNGTGFTIYTITLYDLANLEELIIPEARGAAMTMHAPPNVYNCPALKKVVLPASLQTLGSGGTYSGFRNCTALEEVIFTGGPNVTTIPTNMFENCSSLKSIDLSSVTTINSSAFNGCTSLTEITFGMNLKTITSAFIGCTSLEELYIDGAGVTISASFNDCTSLKYLYLGEKVTTVTGLSFRGSYSLDEIEVDDQNTALEVYDGMLFNKTYTSLLLIPASKTEVIIPDTITAMPQISGKDTLKTLVIGSGITAFGTNLQNCIALESVTIKGGSTINTAAFTGCVSLKEVVFPATLTTITNGFSGCTSLEVLNLPKGVTSITMTAFTNCPIKEINIDPENPVLAMDGNILYNKTTYTMLTYLSAQNPGMLEIPDHIKVMVAGINAPVLYTGSGVMQLESLGAGVQTVIIGEGAGTMAASTFTNCGEYLDVYILGDALPALAGNPFSAAKANPYVVRVHSSLGSGFLDQYLLSTTIWIGDNYYSPTVEYYGPGVKVGVVSDAGADVEFEQKSIYPNGGPITFTVTPKRGYTVDVSSTSGTVSKSGNSYTLSGATEDATVTVSSTFTGVLATGLSLNKSTMTLTAGGSGAITASVSPTDHDNPVVWTTSNPSVATVTNGTVSAVGAGTATITATIDGISRTCAVTVNPEPVSPSAGDGKSGGGFFDDLSTMQIMAIAAVAVLGIAGVGAYFFILRK